MIFFGNSYDYKKITEAENFILYMQKDQQKFLTCLRGRNKFATLLLFLWTNSAFCCFKHSFEPQFDSL
jgi:hypothetical protein